MEARRVIRDDTVGKIGWAMAAGIIAESVEDEEIPQTIFEDMLLCLTREDLAASTAVAVLHKISSRPLRKGFSYRSPEEWRDYLLKQGFLNKWIP